jgi:hypothetical protein
MHQQKSEHWAIANAILQKLAAGVVTLVVVGVHRCSRSELRGCSTPWLQLSAAANWHNTQPHDTGPQSATLCTGG